MSALTKQCLACGEVFTKTWDYSMKYWNEKKYCSRACYSLAIKGISKKGHPVSEETKRKISNAFKGRKLSGEHKQKIKENNGKHWKGKQLSQEHIEKLRLSHSNKRWEGHTPKPKKPNLGLWTITRDPILQLQKRRFSNLRYRARKRNAEGSHTFIEWLELKQKYNNICLCCKRQEPEIKLSEDHIMPLSMGGTDYISNIQPLCVSCNTRKHAKYISFLPPNHIDLIYAEKGRCIN